MQTDLPVVRRVVPLEAVPERNGVTVWWSSVTRQGEWILPRIFRAFAFMGNIEIQLPSHVGVEDHVSAVLGSFEYRRHPRAASWAEASRNTSVVRFTGRVTMSSAEVVIRKDAASDARLLGG